MKFGVTEVSFFVMPELIDQEKKKMVEARSVDSLRESGNDWEHYWVNYWLG
jgi:hypothetical protein